MIRLLLNNEFFYELSVTSLYESEVENILSQQAEQLFPGFHLVRFKKSVNSDQGSARADFALIDKEYQKWWVVEVEMGNHSLENHVVPQVNILTRAVYGEEEIEYLMKQSKSLNKKALERLLTNHIPRVLVVANQLRPDWISTLKTVSVDLIAFEIFRADNNKHAFRIVGDLPTISEVFISNCRFLPYYPNFLYVESPESLLSMNLTRAKIILYGHYSIWDIKTIKNAVYLIPLSANPLDQGLTYELTKGENNTLFLKETK